MYVGISLQNLFFSHAIQPSFSFKDRKTLSFLFYQQVTYTGTRLAVWFDCIHFKEGNLSLYMFAEQLGQ